MGLSKYTKYELWKRQIKLIGWRKTGRNALYYQSNSNCQQGATQRLPLIKSSSPSCTVLFYSNKYLTCSTTYFRCANFFLQSWRPGPLSLTAGLLARLWCSHRCNPTSISGLESQPFWELLQAEIPEMTVTGDPTNTPALQGGFLTTGPPEKSCIILSLTWCLQS